MNKYLLIILVLLLSWINSSGQKLSRDFKLVLPDFKVENSLYDSIVLLDSRMDTTNMGIIQRGAFNRKAKVIPETSFDSQLNDVINSLTDSTSKDGIILFHLRQFSFAELDKSLTEFGYCYLRANLYSINQAVYKKIASIDTVIKISTSIDVTKEMLRSGSELFTDFIAECLSRRPADSPQFTFNDIINIDSIEKSKLSLYNANKYAEGAYSSYKSFKNQLPDMQVMVKTASDGTISTIRTTDERGKKVKIKAKNIYAIVYNGKPFISTEFGYYPLDKRDNDFYFTGKSSVSPNTATMAAATAFFGLLGAIAASNANALFEMKIDHISGGFIRIREIQNGE